MKETEEEMKARINAEIMAKFANIPVIADHIKMKARQKAYAINKKKSRKAGRDLWSSSIKEV
jgi:hypothetical protein